MSDLFSRVGTFEFAEPWWLGLLPLLWLLKRPVQEHPRTALEYSSVALLKNCGAAVPVAPRRSLWWLRVLATALIVFALARPRIEKGADEQKTEGIDVMLVLDASRSMDSKDFDFEGKKVSRRDALFTVLEQFIAKRTQDRIGVIGFAEKPFLVSPLTIDHSWMIGAMAEMKTSLGTAIGSGVEAAVDLLRRSESTNNVIIVVTDGLNTSGTDPLESARLARRFGMRLYTIGVVSYQEMKSGGLDAVTLHQMARLTGGQFFQAADGAALEAIYQQIDQIERQAFRQPKLQLFSELFAWFALPAFGLVLVDTVLRGGRRTRLP
ncbi:vWA domain-containing protein [Oleiharenicola lentus]|uniref:vWA domain-containing protein n=1 Tax=Oleiharenicola lentus TaxID=2508720 RepID=UPI003F664798